MKKTWQNRIIEQRQVPLGELRANPANWRRHPARQGDALAQVIDRVGLVQGAVLNLRSEAQGWPPGEVPTLVDGHLRLELARANGEHSLPAVVVDLSPDEERLVLATLDPLGALAETDAAALEELVSEVAIDGVLGELLAGLVGGEVDAGGPPVADGQNHVRVFTFRLDDDRGKDIDDAFAKARGAAGKGATDDDLFHAIVTR